MEGLLQVFLPRLAGLLECSIGADRKPLKGFGIGQAFDYDFIGDVVCDALDELIHALE